MHSNYNLFDVISPVKWKDKRDEMRVKRMYSKNWTLREKQNIEEDEKYTQ